jgi:hypothetical protein
VYRMKRSIRTTRTARKQMGNANGPTCNTRSIWCEKRLIVSIEI